MLSEILYVKQERKEDKRRWFTDEYWDLFVWNRKDGSYSGFQLCYGKTDQQRALTWMDGGLPSHSGVSESSRTGSRAGNMAAPLLVSDGTLDVEHVTERFLTDSEEIDPEVRQYVSLKLKELLAPADAGRN